MLWIRNNSSFFERKNTVVFSWIKKNTSEMDVIASRDPNSVYVFTHRPSILIPSGLTSKNINDKLFKQYIEKYKIKYIYVEESDLKDFFNKNGYSKIKNGNIDSLYCVSKCT